MFFDCFKSGEAFRWFVCVVIGIMIRSDHLGVTSIVRELSINPCHYESLLHFFRAKSWTLSEIRKKWAYIVARSGLIYRENGMAVLIGDGVKQCKEGRKMPGVKRLVQESENSAKPQYMFGHMFGCIGILIGSTKKLFCTPISMALHDGNEITGQWAEDSLAEKSHVERLVHEACQVAMLIKKPCLLLLDRYYLTVNALKAWLESQIEYISQVVIVTRAKKNCTAYEYPKKSDKPKRGAPRKKGKSVKVQKLFETQAEFFTQVVLTLYGKKTTVSYLCKDLLWGKKLYQPLRFVLVNINGTQAILACTDLTMSPEKIIELYCLRFKIETSFRAFKQTLSGFDYHFWTHSMPKLNRFKKNEDARKELEKIEDEKQRGAIVSTLKAIEGFVMCACIALGLLQMCSLLYGEKVEKRLLPWLRTNTCKENPSEFSIANVLRKTFLSPIHSTKKLGILQLIHSVQEDIENEEDFAS